MSSDQIKIDIDDEQNKDFLSPLSIGSQEQKKLYRIKNKKFVEESIHKADVPEYEQNVGKFKEKAKLKLV